MKALQYTPTPIVEWKDASLPVRIRVKLEHCNHPFVSGNKWWKLKYNLEEAHRLGFKTLLTFGGAYSNHIFATAAAAEELGFDSIGMIAGEEVSNPTLTFARSKGMRLHFVTRSDYRTKAGKEFIDRLAGTFGDFYLIPEGGSNELAVKGCAELGAMLLSEASFDVVCMPVGTGGTMAGIISAMDKSKAVVGFSSLKGIPTLIDDIKQLITKEDCSWSIDSDYHFGGYAKRTPGLDDFIRSVRAEQGIDLDYVYTAKMMYGILDLARRGRFKRGSAILVIHTGGLQAGLYSQATQRGSGTPL